MISAYNLLRAAALTGGLIESARLDRKSWLWTDSLLWGFYAVGLFLFPGFMFPGNEGALLYLFIRIFASILLAYEFLWYRVKSTRDELVVGATLWSRLMGSLLLVFVFGYTFTQYPEKFTEKTLMFDMLAFVMLLLTTVYQFWRGSYRVGNGEQKGPVSNILRLLFLIFFTVGIAEMAFPSWMFPLKVDDSDADLETTSEDVGNRTQTISNGGVRLGICMDPGQAVNDIDQGKQSDPIVSSDNGEQVDDNHAHSETTSSVSKGGVRPSNWNDPGTAVKDMDQGKQPGTIISSDDEKQVDDAHAHTEITLSVSKGGVRPSNCKDQGTAVKDIDQGKQPGTIISSDDEEQKLSIVEALMIRCCGALYFGTSFTAWYATSFRNDEDRINFLLSLIVEFAGCFVAVNVSYFWDGLFTPQETLFLHLMFVPALLVLAANYLMWKKQQPYQSIYNTRSKSQ